MADEKHRPFSVTVDHQQRIIEIQGIRYAFDVFDVLAFGPTGVRFEIGGRRDGVVEVRTLPGDQASAA